MAEQVTDLGVIGTTYGIMQPLDLTLQRNGAAWDLTSYENPTLEVWGLLNKTDVAPNGSLTINVAASGTVRYSEGTADPIHAKAGVYEARVWITVVGDADPEPSGLFRFTIAEGPNP